MNNFVKNPETLTKDELYGLVRKWVTRELELKELDLDRASVLAKAILEHLEMNLEETTPFDALLYMSQDFPEVLDITLHEREELFHEQDLRTVDYIRQCLSEGRLDEISNLMTNKQ